VAANPETDMRALALEMTAIIARDYEKSRAAAEAVGALLQRA
jgi:hypothetical protein